LPTSTAQIEFHHIMPGALTAARGTLLSIALRLSSFLLSQLTVRFVSAAALGKASVPLELLLSTTLFVGREGFRLALTKEIGNQTGGRQNTKTVNERDSAEKKRKNEGLNAAKDKLRRDRRDQQTINVSWLSVPLGTFLSILALLVHLYQCNSNDIGYVEEIDSKYSSLDYKLAGILYCIASFVESLSEPLVIRCLQQMDITTKAKAEGAALVMKSMSCFGCLHLTRRKWFVKIILTSMGSYPEEEAIDENFAVTAFGISQLVYAFVFTTVIYRKGRSSSSGIFWPKQLELSSNNPYSGRRGNKHATIKEALSSMSQNIDLHTLYLVFIFTLQGLFKHALTEADKIVLSTLSGSYDQGVYALAASYGGLAARLLLQPLEENARLLFSREGALVAEQMSKAGNPKENEKKSEACILLKDFEETYFFLIRVVLYIGLVFASIATNYTSVLLRLLAGSRWGSNAQASAALSAFCVYTAFLALNGVTEAFVYGVARSGSDVGKIGVVHAAVGVAFALIAPGLVKTWGVQGLVATNSIAMGMRSIYSIHYAKKYFSKAKETNITKGFWFCALPPVVVIGAFGASFLITKASKEYLYDAQIAAGNSWVVAGAQHIGVGILCVFVIAALSLWMETEIRLALSRFLKSKSD